MKKKQQTFDVLTCTEVQVYPVKGQTKTKAMARVVLNEQLCLTGLRIIDGVNGFFVAYPLDPNCKGEDYRSIFYPLNKELRESIELAILEKYQELIMS
jgi:stage V sporulation protein G